LLLLQSAKLIEAEVLALDQTLEVSEGLAELLEDVGCAVTVTRRVVLWVDRVHDHEHCLALRSLAIERHVAQGVHAVELGIEAVRVEVEEAHEQTRRCDVRALLQVEVVHVGNDQQNCTV